MSNHESENPRTSGRGVGQGYKLRYKLPDPEKKGIMCTKCEKVYWGAVIIGKCICGDTDPNHRINVSSADFNKYSGRFLREYLRDKE